MDGKLPPLPPSDPESLSRNAFDPYFQVGARDFWNGNKVEQILVKEDKCEHHFTTVGTGVECKKCRAGWIGKEMEARDGKLYIRGQLVTF